MNVFFLRSLVFMYISREKSSKVFFFSQLGNLALISTSSYLHIFTILILYIKERNMHLTYKYTKFRLYISFFAMVWIPVVRWLWKKMSNTCDLIWFPVATHEQKFCIMYVISMVTWFSGTKHRIHFDDTSWCQMDFKIDDSSGCSTSQWLLYRNLYHFISHFVFEHKPSK